jgi:hypothetical protein
LPALSLFVYCHGCRLRHIHTWMYRRYHPPYVLHRVTGCWNPFYEACSKPPTDRTSTVGG